MNELITITMVCKGRTHYLKRTMSSIIEAVNASPPCEIIITNYDSKDDLKEYLEYIKNNFILNKGNFFTFIDILNKPYFHQAHAHNIGIKASKGDYTMISSVELYLHPNFIPTIREKIARNIEYISNGYRHVFMVVKTDELIKAGGFDERFEFYGRGDKEFCERLHRRGLKFEIYDKNLIQIIRQTPEEQMSNYRLHLTKSEMLVLMDEIYRENMDNKILIANEGIDWGLYESEHYHCYSE